MIGQAQVVVGGEIEERPAVQMEARRLRCIEASQFAQESLAGDLVQTPFQLGVEVVWVGPRHGLRWFTLRRAQYGAGLESGLSVTMQPEHGLALTPACSPEEREVDFRCSRFPTIR